jgi:hypothetical protein
MKCYWKYLMMACCSEVERSVAGNCSTVGGAWGHSVCKNASAAITYGYCRQHYVLR